MRRRLQASMVELGGWLPLSMVALLLANDRILKPIFHDAVTGKLSDVAICFLMPLLASSVLGIVSPWRLGRRLWAGAAIAAGVFAAVEMSDTAGALLARALRVIGIHGLVLTRDPTDLLALLCVPLAVAYGQRRGRVAGWSPRWATAVGAVAMGLGTFALVATTAPATCGHWSAPVVFQVQGDCGQAGIIVVEPDAYSGTIRILNPATVGLPAGGSELARSERYVGASCPFTLEQGEWQAVVGTCPDPQPVTVDGGQSPLDAGGQQPRVCPTAYRRCRAVLQNGELWFTCDAGDERVPICRSRLTVVP